MQHSPEPHPSTFRGTPLEGRVCVLLAAVLWSSSGLFVKAPWFTTWDAAERGPVLAFWRALFAGVLLLPLARRPRWQWPMLPMVLAFVAMNYTYLSALVLTTAANAIWLQCTSPFWVLLLGLVLWGERPTRSDLLPLILALVGVGLILRYELPAGTSAGTLYGLVSGVFYAVVILSLRRLRAENGVWLIVLNNLCSAACLGPMALGKAWPAGNQWGLLMLFGVGQIGLPYLLMARGLRTIGSQEASAIALVEPLLLPVWVYLAWDEVPAWWTAAGAVLILCGLTLRYWPRGGSAGAKEAEAG